MKWLMLVLDELALPCVNCDKPASDSHRCDNLIRLKSWHDFNYVFYNDKDRVRMANSGRRTKVPKLGA